ncbi:D-alanyl-D-alanine carboxypeptidase/D-alanyl-D-alanine-endopeptidase [Amycolatopsis sp. cg5]|uniref:D-alanyl-D-alanine carboxypeptidase/D-alanyl-D-alanine endopeptidase n=1 Tax=Amycolatopsis sp. cg5 TaxID=3238802 RepID=UPI003523E80F
MPDSEEPSWPSSDEDTGPAKLPDLEYDGQSTAQLRVPPPAANGSGGGPTDNFTVPKITPEQEPKSWFAPKVAPPPQEEQPWARQAPPRPVDQPKPEQRPEQQARRPEPPRPEQQRLEPQRPEAPWPEQQRPEQQQRRPEPPQQRPDQQRPEQPRPDQPRREQARPDQSWPDQQLPPQRIDPQRLDHQRPEPQRPEPTQMRPPQRPDQPQPQPQQAHQQQQPPPERRELPRQQEQVPPAPHMAAPMRIEPSGEARPAEATTESPVTKADDEPKPKRKKRGLLIGAFVLLLVVALGVASALPQVSNRFKLPWAPNAPKGDEPVPVAVTRSLHGPDENGAAPTAEGVANALKAAAGSGTLGKLTGSVIDPANGTVLWDKGSSEPLTPASTTKVLTSAAALLAIDHGFQLSTKVVQGAQPGTAVVVAGGDVTLNAFGAGKDNFYPGSAHLDDLVAQVKKANPDIKKVQLDLTSFAGNATAPGWAAADAPSTFMAQVAPVMIDGGRTAPLDDHSMRVSNPSGVFAQKFAEKLGASAAGTATAPADAKVLGEVKSAPLTELTNAALVHSDNLLAEVLARQVAIATKGEASFAGGAKATLDVLKQNGFDLTGVELSDGSGLSTLNKIPAKVLSQVLAVAAGPDGKDPRTAKLRPLLAGLPVAGGSGTLEKRYDDSNSSDGKGWIRAKTGTLSGVNTLAGVVLDTDGRVLVFTLMSSTAGNSDTDSVRAALDVVAAKLRGCGCK